MQEKLLAVNPESISGLAKLYRQEVDYHLHGYKISISSYRIKTPTKKLDIKWSFEFERSGE